MADNLTPEVVEEVLQQFFDTVGTRQYIGARYVPIFGRKGESSMEWDDTKPYEPLTVVLYQGDSYTSKQYVPVGITVTDTEYWAKTSNWNAQIAEFSNDLITLEREISSNTEAITNEAEAREQAITDIHDTITSESTSTFVPWPDEPQKYGTLDQVLSTLANGKTEWVDPVRPTDEQAETYISSWLDNHPEATTTVLDSSITYIKLHGDLRQLLSSMAASLGYIFNDLDPSIVTGRLIRWATGAYTTTSGPYAATDFTDVSSYDYILVALPAITASGTPPAGLAFYDSSETYVSGIASIGSQTITNSYYENLILPVPAGAKYVRTTLFTEISGFMLKGLSNSSGIAADISDLQDAITSINESIGTITGNVTTNTNNITTLSTSVETNSNNIDKLIELTGLIISTPAYTIVANRLIRWQTGSYTTTTGPYSATGFIDVSDYKYLLVSIPAINYNGTPPAGLAFYDSSETYVSGVPGIGSPTILTSHYVNQLIEVPTGVKYARTTLFSDITGFTFRGYGSESPKIFAGLNLSVLSDSMSAYQGYIPTGNRPYYTGSNAGVSSVDQMWWKVLCDTTGMNPLVIDAWSGSSIAYNFATDSEHSDTNRIPMCSTLRTSRLGTESTSPEIIIVSGGTNDWIFSKSTTTPLGSWDGVTTINEQLVDTGQSTFMESYAVMIRRLQINYPNAIIVCASTYFIDSTEGTITQVNNQNKILADYNMAIQKVCQYLGVPYIDIYNIGFSLSNYYPTYCEDTSSHGHLHMNAAGHSVLAKRYVNVLPSLVKQFVG